MSVKVIKTLLSERFKELLSFEDLNSLLISTRLLIKDDDVALLNRLQEVVDECQKDSETTISKFQQEVFETIRKMPEVKAIVNCQKHGIEKDIVITHSDETVFTDQFAQRPLSIEVNGVYHYARNSEEPLGKDILKQMTLQQLGYHPNSFSIPYYEWAILENAQRKPFIQMLISNALND